MISGRNTSRFVCHESYRPTEEQCTLLVMYIFYLSCTQQNWARVWQLVGLGGPGLENQLRQNGSDRSNRSEATVSVQHFTQVRQTGIQLSIGVAAQSTLRERHFWPRIKCGKISKMPEFYMIIGRKIISLFWGGGHVPLPPSPVPMGKLKR